MIKNGEMVIISDIAACTLGVALFLFVLVYTFQNANRNESLFQQDFTDAEISETFKTVTTAPLAPAEMIRILHSRTLSTDGNTNSIDVFSNRVVIISNTYLHQKQETTLWRHDSDFFEKLEYHLQQRDWSDKKVYLYVMSNQLYNVVYDKIKTHNAKIITINIPQSLTELNSTNKREWHPKFFELNQKKQSIETFNNELRIILENNSKNQKHIKNKYSGLLALHTGFGKTCLALNIISKIINKNK